jgi:hypothetical protein
MKKLLTIVVLSVAGVSFNASATLESTKNYKFVGDTQYAAFCEAAATDNVQLFKNNMKTQLGTLGSSRSQVLNTLLDEENFQCSGLGIVEFSKKRGANELLAFFNNSYSQETQQDKYLFVGDRSYSGFCKAALTDNVDLFKRSLRSKVGVISSSTQGVLDIVLNEKSVQCSGMGLIEFTEKRNATQLTEFIEQSKI